ncbi:hypothetical protein CRUP_027957, partial [Coryphaenoides rupestris]
MSSVSTDAPLPPNLRLPANLVDPSRARRAPPTTDSSLPIIRSCDSAVPTHLSPLLTWVESLESQQAEPVGVSQLHPDVFAVPSRLDILHQVEMWQRSYKRILRQHQGGVVHGPRGPTSYYYMLPMKVRVMGLKVALSSKLAQDYLYVVDSLDLPTPDPQYILDLLRQRH